MPGHHDDDFTDNEEQSFEELFESYNKGMNEDIQVGDKIRGEIISIGSDSVYIDTGTKIDGVVDLQELVDEDGELSFKKGDAIELYVVSFSESEIRLSRALTGQDSRHLLYDAYKDNIPVEGKVKDTVKGGFHVDIMQKRAFCPISQMDQRFVKNPEDYLGDTFQFIITQYEEHGRNIVVSRRLFMEQFTL